MVSRSSLAERSPWATFRLADYKAGQFIIPVPNARAMHLARVRAFFEAQLARPS